MRVLRIIALIGLGSFRHIARFTDICGLRLGWIVLVMTFVFRRGGWIGGLGIRVLRVSRIGRIGVEFCSLSVSGLTS